MFSEKVFVLFSTQFCHQKSVFYITFNLTMHQNIHGGKYNVVGGGGGIFQNATFDIENFCYSKFDTDLGTFMGWDIDFRTHLKILVK